MENNPELEKAEIELEKEMREERMRNKLVGQEYSLSDYIILFAALVHFLAAITSPLSFLITIVRISDGAKIPAVLVWLILPAGLVSLGTSLGLFRIFELSKPQTEQKNN